MELDYFNFHFFDVRHGYFRKTLNNGHVQISTTFSSYTPDIAMLHAKELCSSGCGV
jgi:hypothetical protein